MFHVSVTDFQQTLVCSKFAEQSPVPVEFKEAKHCKINNNFELLCLLARSVGVRRQRT